jgi:hypothetical protein
MRTLENTQINADIFHIGPTNTVRITREDLTARANLSPNCVVLYEGDETYTALICEPSMLSPIDSIEDDAQQLVIMDNMGNLFEVDGPSYELRNYTRSAYFPDHEAEMLYHRLPHGMRAVFTQDMGRVAIDDDHDLFTDTAGQVWVSEDRRNEWNADNAPEPEYLNESTCHPSAYFARFTDDGKLESGSATGYLVGLEIEKEDHEVYYSMEYDEFKQLFPLWHKVKDGSLGDYGFELHSPILPLDPDRIARYIRSNRHLLNCVNADDNEECGGHINLSDPERSPWELFDDIAGYVPLLCALYPSRATNQYCRARPKIELIQNHEKYQAVRVKRDCVEIRIFPAVVDVDRLKWRLELVRYMMSNPAPSPKMVNLKRMQPILSQIHRNPSARINFEERLRKFTQQLR